MRSVLGIFLFALALTANAQRDSTVTSSHVVGGGMQWLADVNYGYAHDGSGIYYQSPLPFGFYRLIHHLRNRDRFCLSLSGFQRKGHGFHYGGSLGGGSEVHGDFSFVRIDVGVNYFIAIGRSGTFLGFGGSLGFVPYLISNMERYAWSKTTGSTSTSVSGFEGINQVNFTLSIDLHQEFKISSRNAITIGIKGMLETPDGFKGISDAPFWYPIRAGKVAAPYLAFKF